MKCADDGVITRRDILVGSTSMVLAGGVLGTIASSSNAATASPPLPWKWTTLDPLEAGRRAYRFYKERGGCGTASYLSLLSLLQEKVGHPWTTMPEMLMAHAAAGGRHSTVSGPTGARVGASSAEVVVAEEAVAMAGVEGGVGVVMVEAEEGVGEDIAVGVDDGVGEVVGLEVIGLGGGIGGTIPTTM